MGSGSGWDVGGVGGSCREEIEGDGLGGRGTEERILYNDIKAEDMIFGREEEWSK